MAGQYLIVNLDRKEYFDPQEMTGCVLFANFSVFDTVGRALMLLTHHNNSPRASAYDPETQVNPNIGRWAGERVVITSESHVGKDMTGNAKLGNLYAVVTQRFDDISTSVRHMIAAYDKYARGDGVPAPAPSDPEVKPDPDPTNGADPEPEDEVEDDLKEHGVRFVTKYRNGQRYTEVQEWAEWVDAAGNDHEGWRTVLSAEDEDDSE